jgi:menaquinone-specific isochorismate synthase
VLGAIRRDELSKVVLAREVLVEADGPLSPSLLLRRLQRRQPGCFVHYADGLVGASPELLVRRVGTRVESRPMAGTARVGDELEALRTSRKDGLEHRFVVEGVSGALAPVCASLDVAAVPVTCSFASVGHLMTPMRGVLSTPAPSALALARRLHPTAAVAGTPVAAALDLIHELESRPRGRYAGPVGWVDGRGDGEWALALRGAELDGSCAVLRAGAGIVAGSDPDAEWAETEAKFEPMLDAIIGA